MSISASDKDDQVEQGNSVYAALARTFTRSLALYFSRPVRIFKPSKVSGWMFLRGLAAQNGGSLSPGFLKGLIQQHGVWVIPRHFIPPMAVNALLGVVLWSSYGETSNFLHEHIQHPLAISLISGGLAGGAQAIVAAPAENLRLRIENGAHSGWSAAWKDVFVGTHPGFTPKRESIRDARQIRTWMKEVGEMAGRGWNGWTWGLFKDIAGFSVFFSVFELTRRAAIALKGSAARFVSERDFQTAQRSNIPRIVHGAALVGGGMVAGASYELVGRSFDVARRTVYLHRVSHPADAGIPAALSAVARKVKEDGVLAFLRGQPVAHHVTRSPKDRIYSVLRVLGRMGPWGAGFLIWEAFGPGLSP